MMLGSVKARPIFSVVLALVVVGGVLNTLSFWPLTIDDAYISLRYAHWLLEGEGLVYNPGERVEGFSNPTWVLLMAATLATGAPSLVGSKVLGVLCHAFSVVAVVGLALELVQPKRRSAWVAAAASAGLLAVSLPANFWPISGMETTFYGAMIMATYWRLAVELRAPERVPWSALIAALAALTRPEAPLVILGAWLARAWAGRRNMRKLAVWMGIFFVPTVGYLLFRLAYFGFPMANTYYQKGHAGTLDALSLYLRPWLSIEAPIAVLGFIGVIALAIRRPRRAWPALLATAGLIFFVVWVSWDWMDNQRFIVPALPMWIMAISAGAALLAEALPARFSWGVPVVSALLVAAQATQSLPLLKTDIDGEMVVHEPRAENMVLPDALTASWHGHGAVPVWAMEGVPPDASIAFTDIGMLGWVGDWEIVDLAGLTDKHTSGATGLDWDGRAAYIGERSPDFIILKTGGAERFAAITAQPWLLEQYEIMDGPRGALAARRKDARWATDAEILANYELATAREPHSRRFVWRRAMWAAAVGTPEQLQAACDLIHAQPGTADLRDKCDKLVAGRGPRPVTAVEPLRAALAQKLPAAPSDPTARVRPNVVALPTVQPVLAPPPPLDAPRPVATSDNPFLAPGKRGAGVMWSAYPKGKVPDYVSISDGVLALRGHGDDPFNICGPLRDTQPGDEVRLAGAWRADAAGASIFIVVLDAHGRKLKDAAGQKLWRLFVADGPRGWEALDRVITMPSSAQRTRVCADFKGEGRADLSDLRLIVPPDA